MYELCVKLLILAFGGCLGWFFTSLFVHRYKVRHRDEALERIVLKIKELNREKKEKPDAAD